MRSVIMQAVATQPLRQQADWLLSVLELYGMEDCYETQELLDAADENDGEWFYDALEDLQDAARLYDIEIVT